MRIGRWSVAFMACLLLAGPADAAGKEFKPGEACKRQTDDFAGIVKMDACHRVYCGRKDVKDIMEIDPGIGERMHCTWQLVRDHCKCVRTGAPNMTPMPQ
ncbi:MAG: hypothetical protein K8R18_04940 [Parvibaculum sp.]|uniref:hypothetical protein n=1 Tax=Parvibaculum sp. TaxID=2024848 RepID=UPI0025F6C477|nr:hypothetical protein [Parvibaculum sp.]MCE9648956.1 hypothetical protein [Parvibaculum sp.]